MLLLVYVVYDVAVLVFKLAVTEKQVAAKTVFFDTNAVKQKPNVYLLLLDEYPGYKSLKDSFAFANDSLYHFLQSKSFALQPIFSNYNMTFYSMASMLNMEYISKPYIALQNTVAYEQERLQEIKNAQVLSCFKAMGYSFNNYSIFDIADKPGVKGNSFVVSQAALITSKIFFNKLLKDLGWHFITGKNKISFIENFYLKDKRNNNFIEQQLLQSNLPHSTMPQFTYAHFNMPHPPYFYDSVGKPIGNDSVFNAALYSNRPFFLSYLKYTNKKIEAMVTAICKNDSGAVVIVMSDHGFREYGDVGKFNSFYFDNFCAIRFPDKNYLPMKEKWSNVNFFRYLFNSQFNQKIPYLSDSSIFLKDKPLQ